jgi:DnaJ-class molecular chaperone
MPRENAPGEHSEPTDYSTKNYYEILDVSPAASQDEIRAAFIRLSKEHHPDTGGDQEKYKYISEAYTILKDPAERSRYNIENDIKESVVTSSPPAYEGEPIDKERQAEQLKRAFQNLRQFSDSISELERTRPRHDDNRDLIKRLCVVIETLLEQSQDELRGPQFATKNTAGETYIPEESARAVLMPVIQKLESRIYGQEKTHF